MPGTTYAFSRPPRTLVTGGAGGIGLGVVGRLLEHGATVAVADLPGPLSQLADPTLASVVRVPIDVTDEASVRAGVGLAAERLGGLDRVVNAAGICRLAAVADLATSDWDAVIDVNLKGTFLVLREALPYLRAAGTASIVNLSSNGGKRGYPTLGAYCASKFGVIGLTQTLAAEVGSAGIRVNAVCPATIAETGMGADVIRQRLELGFADSVEELAAQRTQAYPLGRVGTVADVVEAVLFLLSDGASWISGESLNIDGGSLAG
jgi:NAD(P)-dependent dehydrogenase (short-subunit alcohol dehydrogenase family)